jgi:hypothetical protein
MGLSLVTERSLEGHANTTDKDGGKPEEHGTHRQRLTMVAKSTTTPWLAIA